MSRPPLLTMLVLCPMSMGFVCHNWDPELPAAKAWLNRMATSKCELGINCCDSGKTCEDPLGCFEQGQFKFKESYTYYILRKYFTGSTKKCVIEKFKWVLDSIQPSFLVRSRPASSPKLSKKNVVDGQLFPLPILHRTFEAHQPSWIRTPLTTPRRLNLLA